LTAEPGLTKSLQYTESLAAAVGDTTKSALEYPLVIKTPKRLNTTETDFGALKKLVDKDRYYPCGSACGLAFS
jgi:hypothetical protein